MAVTVEEALAQIATAAGPPRQRAERVSLDAASGRVAAEDVCVDRDVPGFRRAGMDGFAVRTADADEGATLRVVGSCAAGDPPAAPLASGQAVRIMTGAPVPENAERVLPLEWTEEAGAEVRVVRLGRSRSFIQEAGRDARAGEVVLAAGSRIDPGGVGVLATAGRTSLMVAVPARVAVLGTGSELVPADAEPGPAEIRASNAATLQAQVRRAGGCPRDLGIAGDDHGALRHAIRAGLDADLLVLSGGVGGGDRDLVPDVLESVGVERVFYRWAVRPGHGLWFGVHGDTLVFGLSGGPAGSYVGFEVLAVPALRTRLGRPFEARRVLRALYDEPWKAAHPMRRYRPVRFSDPVDGVSAVTGSGRGSMFGLAGAEGLAVLPENAESAGDGADVVDVIPLGTLS